MLYATVRQRKIHVKNPVTVIQNGVNVDELILDMDDEWRQMTSIVAVFTLKYTEQKEVTETVEKEDGSTEEVTKTVTEEKETAKEMLHTFGEPILVPWECLTETGLLSVSCTGYVDSEKVMTTMKPDSFWNVVQNGASTGDTPMEPTPTLYEQVLAAAGSANAAAAEASAVRSQLLEDKANGVFDGEDGVTPTVTVGTVTTGSTGSEAQVYPTGTPTEVVLNFVLPRGAQGVKGDTGIPGPQGERGLQGNQGEKGETGVKGDKGDKGEQGERGDPGVYIGSEKPTDPNVKVWISPEDPEAPDTSEEEKIMDLLIDLGIAPVVLDNDGSVLTDGDNSVLLIS